MSMDVPQLSEFAGLNDYAFNTSLDGDILLQIVLRMMYELEFIQVLDSKL